MFAFIQWMLLMNGCKLVCDILVTFQLDWANYTQHLNDIKPFKIVVVNTIECKPENSENGGCFR